MSDPLPMPAPARPAAGPQPVHHTPTLLRPATPMPGALPKIAPPPTLGRPKDDLSPLSMDDGPTTATIHGITGANGGSQIKAFGVKALSPEREFKRHANLTGNGAVHVKSFHGNLSDDGMQRVDDRINDWLEGHPNVEVKFATTTVGVWDGKTKDQAIIINVWY